MEAEWTDTAKRLAAHPRFAWLDGMAVAVGSSSVRLSSVSATAFNRDGLDAPEYPCLTDWATVGVLLGMLHDAAPWIVTEGLAVTLSGPTEPVTVYRCRSGMGSFAYEGAVRWPGMAVALALLRVWGDG